MGTEQVEPGLFWAGLLALVLVFALLWALFARRRTLARLAEVEASVVHLEQAMRSAAKVFAESDRRINGAFERLELLGARQEKIDASGSKAGFNQAIALSRRGADIEELMQTCGVSRGEASLIHTMYSATKM